MSDLSQSFLFVQRHESAENAFSVTVGPNREPKTFEGFTQELLGKALEECLADDLFLMPRGSDVLKAASVGAAVPIETEYVGGKGPAGRTSHLDRSSDSWGFIAGLSTNEAEETLAKVLGRNPPLI